jgi:SAM-dependent methyltransferase
MHEWLTQLRSDQRVLDLGSGSGSFDYSLYRCPIFSLDNDFGSLVRIRTSRPERNAVHSESHRLPFRSGTFSLVICNHTLEHFPDARATLAEIGRILEPNGGLIVAVPDGYGFDDGLYRYIFEGGGHLNRFRFADLVGLVQEVASVRLVRWQDLYASFVYLRKPGPAVLPHLRPRARRIAQLPAWLFRWAQFSLNVFVRLAGRWAAPNLALYGWSLHFRRTDEPPIRMPSFINVCRGCGAGHEASSLTRTRLLRVLYRCPGCNEINPYFKPRRWTI